MVDILMATYNGEMYISQQIESIVNQTYKEWILYIRDDGSNDKTISILEKYKNMYPEKIFIIRDNKRGLGAKMNFAELMKYSTNDYCMFADQDDIWLEDKIEKSMNEMNKMEEKFGKNRPLLVHTNLKVVDKELNVIDNSFWRYQNLNPDNKKLNYLLVQNNITGCTMLMNKELIKFSIDIPVKCIMHDWWIGLVAAAKGEISYIEYPTILYRQHGNNEVGAHKYNSKDYFKQKVNNINNIKESINNGFIQAQCFYEKFNDIVDIDNKVLLEKFLNLKNINLISRKISIIKNKFYKQGFTRKVSYLLFT